jgi:hypothetical protein
MCSVTAMRPAQTRAFRILHDQRCCSAGLLALPRRADPSHPIPLRMRSATTALDGDSPAFPLVRACVEPPAGIEPATPSLPSMVGPFGGQRGTSLRSIELQVAGLIDDREMGCCEAVRGAAAGKSLARSPVGCPVVAGLRLPRVEARALGPPAGLDRCSQGSTQCWQHLACAVAEARGRQAPLGLTLLWVASPSAARGGERIDPT